MYCLKFFNLMEDGSLLIAIADVIEVNTLTSYNKIIII